MASATINGINVSRLRDTMDVITEQPKQAHFRFRATNHWVNGTHNRSFVKEFFEAGQEDTSRTQALVFDEDEPPVLLGDNQGANPVEFVLVGLAGCLTSSLVAHAAARGMTLNSVESRLEGEIDVRGFLGMSEDIRNGYQNIQVIFKIDSDESEETIRELVELAKRRSPVYDVVTNKVPVTVGFQKI